MKKIISFFILLILLVLIGGYLYFSNNASNTISKKDLVTNEHEDLSLENNEYGKGVVLYVAQTIHDNNCFYVDDDYGCGKRIIRIDESGEGHIVINNTYNIDKSNLGNVEMLNFSDETKSILFKQNIESSASNSIYLYDINTGTYKTVVKMDRMSGDIISPDGSKLLKMHNDRSLHIIDLWTGIESTLVTLEENETLVETINGYGMDMMGNYRWGNDSSSVIYNVYNPFDDLEVYKERTPIDSRRVDVNK